MKLLLFVAGVDVAAAANLLLTGQTTAALLVFSFGLLCLGAAQK